MPTELTDLGSGAFGYCTSLKSVTIAPKSSCRPIMAYDSPPFYYVPSLEKIIFTDGREVIDGYGGFIITSDVEIEIPSSVKYFNFYMFFVCTETDYAGSKGHATLNFYGDCPEFRDEPGSYEGWTIRYDPTTSGWEDCPLIGKCIVEPMKGKK